jgi:ferredoxin
MATMITTECINCGACEPECPNTAIYAGGVQYEYNGQMFDALSSDYFYIVPEKCTECVGHFNKEQCAAVCPVDCCVPDPNHTETEDQLFAKTKKLHAGKDFAPLSSENSRFRA